MQLVHLNFCFFFLLVHILHCATITFEKISDIVCKADLRMSVKNCRVLPGEFFTLLIRLVFKSKLQPHVLGWTTSAFKVFLYNISLPCSYSLFWHIWMFNRCRSFCSIYFVYFYLCLIVAVPFWIMFNSVIFDWSCYVVGQIMCLILSGIYLFFFCWFCIICVYYYTENNSGIGVVWKYFQYIIFFG